MDITTSQVQRIKPLYRGTQIVWSILAVVDVLLLFRFLLRAFGANEGAGFTQFIYAITFPFAGPFVYVFDLAQNRDSVLEWGTILAIVFYTLLGAGIVKLLRMGKPVSTPEAEEKLDTES